MESQTQAEQTQQIKDFILSMKCIFDKNFTPSPNCPMLFARDYTD